MKRDNNYETIPFVDQRVYTGEKGLSEIQAELPTMAKISIHNHKIKSDLEKVCQRVTIKLS